MEDSFARYRPYVAMLLLFIVVLAGTIYFLRRPEPTPLTIVTPTPRAAATPTTLPPIVVDVRGAVAKPDVYSLPSGSRLQDALLLAGGAIENADTRTLNLARRLNDGEQIYVPLIGEVTPTLPAAANSNPSSARTPSQARKININTATVAELDALPGVGPVFAQRVVDYRNQNGPFKKIDDIKKVRGFADTLFKQIENLIVVQ